VSPASHVEHCTVLDGLGSTRRSSAARYLEGYPWTRSTLIRSLLNPKDGEPLNLRLSRFKHLLNQLFPGLTPSLRKLIHLLHCIPCRLGRHSNLVSHPADRRMRLLALEKSPIRHGLDRFA